MTIPAGVFADIAIVITDAGDGNLHVQKGPNGNEIPMQMIDDIIAGQPDPTQFLAFNIAARLALAGIVSIQTAPGSGVASPSALATLNAASFKGY